MASIGFRWLDILEKEFDKAFVDLDLAIGELESDEPNVVFTVRQQLCTLSSCFAQLTHKAQTIFQNSAKLEAELIHMRAELTESRSKRELLESELHHLLLQLHSTQLSKLPNTLSGAKRHESFKPDIGAIKKKLDAEIKLSPTRKVICRANSDELMFSPSALEPVQHRAELVQMQSENAALRNDVLALTSEVYGAKLAAKYLDKELAGRIQQLQLLGREMRGDVRDKLWRQLESEILLQRHKTVVRACRRNNNNNPDKCCPATKPDVIAAPDGTTTTEHFGDIRTVVVRRKPDQGLGISITGGREHGVPILISELEPNGPAAISQQLYIGDAILFVNEIDLRTACHREAVSILQQQTGDCTLKVQYIAADDSDNSLEEDGFNFRFFDEAVCDTKSLNNHHRRNRAAAEEIINTPTAPRTPDSISTSRLSGISLPNTPLKKSSTTTTHRTNILEALPQSNSLINMFECDANNTENGNNNVHEEEQLLCNIKTHNNNNNKSSETTAIIAEDFTNNTYAGVDTNDLILVDNATNNIIKLENFKKVDVFSNIDNNNFNTSTNSLNSENLSSPMQTSTDVYLDSEVLSTTDMASNDSHSPKNLQTMQNEKPPAFDYKDRILDIDLIKYFVKQQQQPPPVPPPQLLYTSNESLSQPKTDQSLLNSGSSSPLHQPNREYKKQKKHKKKYFGVKTLQSIFNKHNGYSDVSTTASENGDDIVVVSPQHEDNEIDKASSDNIPESASACNSKSSIYPETSPQFEENIHALLSDIFLKSFTPPNSMEPTSSSSNVSLTKSIGTKKYFSLHGQNLRVGKALRLCPNEDYTDMVESEQNRKEKLLARYVYNANSINADGVGDPDFGTPV